ncbi:D-alanine--D-alanine ligase family protein [Dactylosporangium darangshiense]|uniref:D-alanine--D-alanine ligase n=1 Tax=Dactylosporangium darangshiense TaxID=579108 RepID=A0ABP8DSV2_9ACTN
MSTNNRPRVMVIGGGQNCEHSVSIATAASVAGALDRERYEVESITITEQGLWIRPGGEPVPLHVVSEADVVFPLVHGPRGEDGTLAALCELAGVPYVGSGVRAGAIGMDKWATKLVAEALGIRTATAALVTGKGPRSLPPLPVVVKPVAAGSSYGVTRVDHEADLDAALAAALALDDRVLVEEVVHGREIDIAVLGRPDGSHLIGPPLEIVVPDGGIFDTDRKYGGTAQFRLPAVLDADELTRLETAALTMFEALGCAGVARLDFFLTHTGLVLNEVNTTPGMTEQSQVPKMFAAVGISYTALLTELVQAALAR